MFLRKVKPWPQIHGSVRPFAFAMVVLLCTASQLELAHAQEPVSAEVEGGADARARVYYDAGSEAYGAGDYETALAQFRRAFAASARPALHYNIGQAAERAGQIRVAIRSFERFVEEVPDSPRRPEVQRHLVVLRDGAEGEPLTVVSDPDNRAPTPAETAAAGQSEASLEPAEEEASIVESPWLWVGIAALVAGGVVLAVLLSQSSINEDAHGEGTFGTITTLGVSQ